MSKVKWLSNLTKMLIFVASVMFTLSACDGMKEILSPYNDALNEESSSNNNETKIGNSLQVSGISYTTIPSIGSYTPNSTSNVILTGICGSHDGGVLMAKVQSKTGDLVTIRISKQDGSMFTNSGAAYIKRGSVCGSVCGSGIQYTAGVYSIDITFTANFSLGVDHYYPIIIGNNGSRYYAEPVMVHTLPMFNSTWTLGGNLGTVNGVQVKCNGTNTNQSSTNSYQCTEFCARYYEQIYGRDFTHYLAAYRWFSDYTNLGDLERCTNGGAKPPRPGDILCMSGGGNNGHVAIIIRVESSYILIAHQNSGTTWNSIGASIARTNNTISNPTGYTIQGWLRMPQY